MTITLDTDSEIPPISPVCIYCKHWLGIRRCSAFRDTLIPLPIWLGEHDHTAPYPGDHGIQFEHGLPNFEEMRRAVGIAPEQTQPGGTGVAEEANLRPPEMWLNLRHLDGSPLTEAEIVAFIRRQRGVGRAEARRLLADERELRAMLEHLAAGGELTRIDERGRIVYVVP